MNQLASRLKNNQSSLKLISLQLVSLAAVGMVAPYINLYLVDQALSPTLIGTLSSVGAFLALSLTPILNSLADKYGLHRRLLMVYMFIFAAANAVFALSSQTFLLVTAVLMFNISIGPSMTLSMQLTMTQIANESKDTLGQTRSFAALGFALASLLAGRIFDWGGYEFLFWTSAAFALMTLQISTIFPGRTAVDQASKATQRRRPHPALYILIIGQFFIMMGIRNAFSFTFVHLVENLGVASKNIGIWAAFLAGIEVPFFILSDRYLNRWAPRNSLIVSTIGIVFFYLFLAMANSQFWVLILFFYRGALWPVMYLSSFKLVSQISHPSNIATNQAIVHVTMPALAILLTGSTFGWIYEHMSFFTFFMMSAVTCATAAALLVIFRNLFDQQKDLASLYPIMTSQD